MHLGADQTIELIPTSLKGQVGIGQMLFAALTLWVVWKYGGEKPKRRKVRR